jgi:serine/threonine-protein kinase
MATVFLGKLRGPVGFSPIVAIKALHPHFAREPEFVRMFLDEARLAARVRHANVVPVIDVHDEDGNLFLVLEYIHGESLARLLTLARREERLPSLGIVSAVVCDVLHGLHAAHEARDERGEPLGIVHRDVSPHNVLVGADGVAHVFDFGIAKAAGRITTTREGQVKGKFAYMAPEQLRGEAINRQADVYAAAIVLWETLTGERLFKADSEGNTVARALFAPIPLPSSVRSDLPAAVDAVVMRGLARERSARFTTAKEMALALQAAVPPAPPPEVGEWVEGLAFEALEERARLIATIESGVADTVSVQPEGRVALSAPPPPARARSRAVLALGAMALVALGIGVGLRARVDSTVVAPPATVTVTGPLGSPEPPDPSAMAATIAPPSGVESAGAPEPPPPAPPRNPAPAGPRARAWSSGRGAAAAAAPAGSSPARCTRRTPDGVITFDAECLRGAQRTP